MYWRVGKGECVGLVCGGERHWAVGILGEVRTWVAVALVQRGRCQQAKEGDGAMWLEGCCPLRKVSTG